MNQCANIGDDFTCKAIVFAETALATRCMTCCVVPSTIWNHSGMLRAILVRADVSFSERPFCVRGRPETRPSYAPYYGSLSM